MPDKQRAAMRRLAIIAIVLIALVSVLRSRPFLTVPAGHRAVIFNVFSGVEDRVLGEGYRFLIPLVQYPVLYNIRERTYTMTTSQEDNLEVDPNPLECLTADGQPVTLDISVRYKPIEADLPKLYREIGSTEEYISVVVRPQVRALVRMVVAQFRVTQVYSDRQELEAAITERLRGAFAGCHLELLDLALRNISFSAEFQQAVERKQAAQQEVEKMTYLLEQAVKDKEKAIVEAQGKADAIRRVAASITRNPAIVDYQYVEQLNPNAKVLVVDGNTLLNVGDLLGAKP